MLRVLSVCMSVVLVGVFLTYYSRVAAFLVGLLFSFVNEQLDEPLSALYLWVEALALFSLQQHFVIHMLEELVARPFCLYMYVCFSNKICLNQYMC